MNKCIGDVTSVPWEAKLGKLEHLELPCIDGLTASCFLFFSSGLPGPINAFTAQQGVRTVVAGKRASAIVYKRSVQMLQLNGTMSGTSALPVIISLAPRPLSGGKHLTDLVGNGQS